MALFKKKISLPTQVIIALVLGVIAGLLLYGQDDVANYIKPFGDVFLNLIKMIIIPIVFCSLALSISNLGDSKKVGSYGWKAILYFEIITTIAIGLGLIIGNLFKPGSGLDPDKLPKGDITKYQSSAHSAEQATTYGNHLIDTLVHIVPTNLFESMAKGELLPIIFFAVFFGLGLAAIGEKAEPVKGFLNGTLEAVFWMINKILKLAPIGVFAFICTTVMTFGASALIPLFKLLVFVVFAMVFFVIVVLGIVARMVGISIFSIMKILKSELLLAFSTSSSEAVLPIMMKKMERFGSPKDVTSFVIPIGYSFNLDGSALYQSIAALFVAQMYDIHLSLTEQLVLMATLMIASKGMAGVPGVSIVVLLTTLTSMNITAQGLALIIGVDRLLDMVRTCVNVIGNALSTVVIAKWENVYDKEKGQNYLNSI
ncbi:cation:dicarboxylase symporter family transporter [Staphylococcus epidermidis]|jgi:proton/sodium-glutamate symport protein|uniref:cation:dicarboxylate symporter family transporter n=1 Tax=Staphylococcus epidermidis TaxID=1282 RepID=UPI000493C19E|nr:cation:dicarboxylase symporter family transporter [Staphylococcus epidermidis]MBM0774162.1 glutamate:protein symporter [Staphylococcus epidermidis]MBM0862410.1 glutamate:protein symporter [Staphylococcus epidermidis]MBM5968886.1 cation:dicarboxylase symporter family transporter [Staphylococcus epidermidis]MBM6076315.1 cation:dicarboxylase symporter family transporter [Staphylococcus epidermidis]MBM6080873.1 cation:dicarboxylase symporter family transporter [Staphylococcus epidermidis]